jgi:hypothetical protein
VSAAGQIIYFISGNQLVHVAPQTGLSESVFSDIKKTGLIVEKGSYRFGENIYRLENEGLYFFADPLKQNEMRIVLGNDVVENSLLISNAIVRGNKDDEKKSSILTEQALHRFLILTCTYACFFVRELLSAKKFDSRVVMTLTTEMENGYNDGHTLLEVYDDASKKHVLIDVDKKCFFESHDGEKMDLLSFCSAINLGTEIKIRSAANFPKVDWSGFSAYNNGYNFQFIEQMFGFDQQQQIELYKRICNLPVIREENKYFSVENGTPLNNSWKNKVIFLTENEFRNRFYSA